MSGFFFTIPHGRCTVLFPNVPESDFVCFRFDVASPV